MSDPDRIAELLDEANALPHGPVQMSVMQEAVRAADAYGDEEWMFDARLQLACSGIFSGAAEQSLVALGWCLNKYKQDPQPFAHHEYSLSWEFKHITGAVLRLPQISLEQIEGLLQEMEVHYAAHNYSQRALDKRRYHWERTRGNRDAAIEYFRKFQTQPRDDMADCQACEHSAAVHFKEYLGEYEQAIEHAQPLLRRELTCETIPRSTYSTLLKAHAILNRLDKADELQALGYRVIRDNPNYLEEIGHQLCYLSFRGQLQKGAQMFARHLDWALKTFEHSTRFDFLIGAKWLFEELASAAPPKRKASVKLNLPPAFSLHREDATYDVAELLDWINAETNELAARFDKRNKTSRFTDDLLVNYRYQVAGV